MPRQAALAIQRFGASPDLVGANSATIPIDVTVFIASGGIEVLSFAKRLFGPGTGTAGRIEIEAPAQPDKTSRINIRVWTLVLLCYKQNNLV